MSHQASELENHSVLDCDATKRPTFLRSPTSFPEPAVNTL
jgi:hypothetical protein